MAHEVADSCQAGAGTAVVYLLWTAETGVLAMGNLNGAITIKCNICGGTGSRKAESGDVAPCGLCSGTGRAPMSETGPPSTLETLFADEDALDSREEIGILGAALLLLQTGFAHLRNTNSDRGALVAGILAGLAVTVAVQLNIPALLSFSLRYFNAPPMILVLALLAAGGLTAGAMAALLWAAYVDRRQLPGLRLGMIGGTLTAVAGYVLIPIILYFGPDILFWLLFALVTTAIGAAKKWFRTSQSDAEF